MFILKFTMINDQFTINFQWPNWSNNLVVVNCKLEIDNFMKGGGYE